MRKVYPFPHPSSAFFQDKQLNFLHCFPLSGVLAEGNRLKRVDGVISSFNKIMRARRGEVDCTVTTAKVRYYFTTRYESSTFLTNFAQFLFKTSGSFIQKHLVFVIVIDDMLFHL